MQTYANLSFNKNKSLPMCIKTVEIKKSDLLRKLNLKSIFIYRDNLIYEFFVLNKVYKRIFNSDSFYQSNDNSVYASDSIIMNHSMFLTESFSLTNFNISNMKNNYFLDDYYTNYHSSYNYNSSYKSCFIFKTLSDVKNNVKMGDSIKSLIHNVISFSNKKYINDLRTIEWKGKIVFNIFSDTLNLNIYPFDNIDDFFKYLTKDNKFFSIKDDNSCEIITKILTPRPDSSRFIYQYKNDFFCFSSNFIDKKALCTPNMNFAEKDTYYSYFLFDLYPFCLKNNKLIIDNWYSDKAQLIDEKINFHQKKIDLLLKNLYSSDIIF